MRLAVDRDCERRLLCFHEPALRALFGVLLSSAREMFAEEEDKEAEAQEKEAEKKEAKKKLTYEI